jgi:hypothetical protein
LIKGALRWAGVVTKWSWDKEGCKAGEGNGGGEKVPKWGEVMTTGVPKWGEATATGAVPDLHFGVSGFLVMWEVEASSTRWLVAVGTE